MGTPKLFIFQLQDADGLYYYVDNNGEVQTSASEKSLQYSPRNWEQTKRKFGRDGKYWGITRSTTTPYEFVADGCKILKAFYYKDGLINYDAYCKLTIKKRNDAANGGWRHEVWFTTEIDFANGSEIGADANGAAYFRVNLSDRALPEIIDDALNKEINVPLDTGYQTIQMTGFPISARYRWIASDLPTSTIISGGVATSQFYVFAMGLAEDTSEYFKRVFYAQAQGTQIQTLNNTANDSNRFAAIQDSLTVGFTISGEIDVDNVGGAANMQLRVDLLEKDMEADTNTFTNLFISGTIATTATVAITGGGNFTLSSPAKSYFIVARAAGTTQQNVEVTINDFDFVVNFDEPLPATTCPAYRYDFYAQKVLEIATNNETGVTSGFLNQSVNLADLWQSYYYNSVPRNEFVTCGDAIRGLSNPVIKTTLGDMLQDLYARWMAGASSFSGFRIERLDYFLNPNILIGTINEISAGTFKMSTATDLIYNSIRTGYDSGKADDKLNGKFDFASEQFYKLPAKRIQEETDLTSPYIASPYEIERLRSNLSGKDTTTDQSDNRVFLLSAYFNSGANQYLLRDFQGEVNGFLTDEIYNLAFRPHYNPLRHIPYLRSIMGVKDGVDAAPSVEFLRGERYTAFSTNIGGIYIPEDGDIKPGAQSNGYHPQRLFHPVYFDFESKPEPGFMQSIENNPFGVIRFFDSTSGNWYEGFVMDVEVSPDEKDIYKMRLLCSPNVDPKTLID